MRWLIGLVVAAMVVWGGYWFAGAEALRRGAEGWFAGAPARGLVAEKSALVVRGFPNRFDLTVSDPRIGDPARGVEWQAPFAQLLMLSYKPWHLIAALPHEQILTLPAGRFDIRSDRLMGSLVLIPGTDLALDRLRLDGSAVSVATGGESLAAESLLFATERDAATPNAHRIGVEVVRVLLPAGVAARTGMPGEIARIHADATATLSAPIDRHIRDSRPQLTAISLREARVEWGEVTAILSGDLVADAAGYASGTLMLRLTNWRAALAAAQAAGLVDADTARTAERALQFVALASGDASVLEVPVGFADGQMRIAMIPLGQAPRLN